MPKEVNGDKTKQQDRDETYCMRLKLDLQRVSGAGGKVDESFVVGESQEQMMVFNGKYPENAVKPNTKLP